MSVTQDGASSLVAGEVRAWLARKGMSARGAAEQLGWDRMYLQRRLSGEISLTVNDLEALAEILDIPMTAFFRFPEEAAGPPRRPGFSMPRSPATVAA